MQDEKNEPATDPPDYGNATAQDLERFRQTLGATGGVYENGRWTWRLPCPRCQWEVVVELERIRALDVKPTPRVVCHCAHNHARRPDAVVGGCGFDVTVQITPPASPE